MKNVLLIVVLIISVVLVADYLQKPAEQNTKTPSTQEQAKEPTLSVIPESVLQGEPALIVLEGVSSASVKTFKFDGKEIGFFEHEGKPAALIGIDLRGKTGLFALEVELEDGNKIERNVEVVERQIARAPLGIPEKLGGNTPESERNLLNTLAEEGRIISAVPSSNEKLWSGKFRLPVNPPVVVTDTYGYSRITGGSSISHKGTDYRAAIGTPIYAMNSGIVRLTREMRNYGKTVIVDHGMGIHTIYMHLSEINVGLNQRVEKGQMIGKSGDTGYVIGPHLHLTVRVNGISIDPQKFMEIMGE